MAVSTVIDISGLTASPRVKSDGGPLPPMITYAQNFEDVLLRRALQDVTAGFYVDIGAADPDIESVTRWFYESGWSGINVEPDPRYFPRLEERRPKDTNIQCVVGGTNGSILFNLTTPGGLSTGSAKRFAEMACDQTPTKTIVAPVITLDDLLASTGGKDVDFLKIDVEGMEAEILASASLTLQRPKIIVVEATAPLSQRPVYDRWEPLLLQKEYLFAWFDGLNRFYIRREDEWRLSFFRTQPCYFDNFFSPTIDARTREEAERHAGKERELIKALEASAAEFAVLQRANSELEDRCQRTASEMLSRIDGLQTDLTEAGKAVENAQQRAAILEHELERARHEIAEASARQLAAETAAANAQRLALKPGLQRSMIENIGHTEEEVIAGELGELAVENDVNRTNATDLYSRWRFSRLSRSARHAARAGNWRATELHYHSALNIVSDSPHIWLLYGHSLKEQGKITRAEQAYRKAVSLDPRNADAHLQLGHALKLKGDSYGAVQCYSNAFRLQPSLEWARKELIAAGISAAQFVNIVLGQEANVPAPPTRPPVGILYPLSFLRLKAARRAARRKKWPIVIAHYRQLTRRFPDMAAVWMQLGNALRDQGELEEAQIAYFEALTRNHERADLLVHLGDIFETQRDYQASRTVRQIAANLIASKADRDSR